MRVTSTRGRPLGCHGQDLSGTRRHKVSSPISSQVTAPLVERSTPGRRLIGMGRRDSASSAVQFDIVD